MVLYIAVDGDNVGSRLSELINNNSSDAVVKQYANGVANEMREFSVAAAAMGANIILCSGDSVLLSISAEKISSVLSLLKATKFATYSAGTGRTKVEAASNLQYAKVNGKNQTWHWQKPKPFWLKTRVENPVVSFFGKKEFLS